MIKVTRESFNKYKKIYAISDLHGFLDLFDQFYDNLDLKADEALVIVGDIIEKGEKSLALVRRLMELCGKWDNIYIIKGNNDILLSEFTNNLYSDGEVVGYLTRYENMQSILIDIAKENDIDYTSIGGIKRLKKVVIEDYQKEMAFLDSFSHILECEWATFAHAGIEPNIELEKQDEEFVLAAKSFASMGYHFDKPVVVGHWPSSNYSENKIIVNPYYDKENNIISIDGGVGIKGWYQINILIIDENGIKFDTYDDLPKEIALENQDQTQDAVTLIFPKTEVQILERGEKKSKCYVPYLQKTMEFENEVLYQYKGKMYCEDFTNFDLPISVGDVLSKCIGSDSENLYKKNGVVGYYKGKTCGI